MHAQWGQMGTATPEDTGSRQRAQGMVGRGHGTLAMANGPGFWGGGTAEEWGLRWGAGKAEQARKAKEGEGGFMPHPCGQSRGCHPQCTRASPHHPAWGTAPPSPCQEWLLPFG